MNGLASPLALLSGKHAYWLASLLNQAGSAARGWPRRGLPVPAGHRLHSQEPAVHQRLGLAATGRCAPLSLVLRQHTGPPPPLSIPFLSQLRFSVSSSWLFSPPADSTPHSVGEPAENTTAYPSSAAIFGQTLLSSPGWGGWRGRGGGSAVLGDVRVPVSQHALGRRLWPSPSQHALYHKGLSFSFLSYLSFRCFVCWLLLLFTPHRTWIKSVSAVLYVCRLVAFLRHSFPFDRIPQPGLSSQKVAWGLRPLNQAETTPTHLPAFSPPPPYTHTAVWGQDWDFHVLKPGTQVWE